ncbi:MAG: P-II family nitrogen regulator [Chloroflexi bacterium]|nr:P-II family nitrogen regulator [Chloroflexota bacterium]
MKKIEAIIREEKLEAVRKALEDESYFGMTVSEVSGRGREGGVALQWRVGEYRVEFLPRVRVEIVILDEDLSKVLATIMMSARTGEKGDGKIFVLPVEDAVRIRTGDTGDDAI